MLFSAGGCNRLLCANSQTLVLSWSLHCRRSRSELAMQLMRGRTTSLTLTGRTPLNVYAHEGTSEHLPYPSLLVAPHCWLLSLPTSRPCAPWWIGAADTASPVSS